MDDFLMEVSEEEPGQRYSSSQSHWFNHRTNMLHMGDQPDLNIAGRLAGHELSHFGLHCSTPYGLVMDDLCQMQNSLVMGFCARFGVDLKGQKIPRPLQRFVRKYGGDLSLLESHFPNLAVLSSLASWFIRPWSFSVFLENALEAEGPACDESKTDADGCHAVSAYEEYYLQESRPWPIQVKAMTEQRLFGQSNSVISANSFSPVKSLAELGIDVATACYRMKFPRSSPTPLGGFDIFEGAATQIEGLKGRGEEMRRLLEHPVGQRYMSMWILFLWKYPRLKDIASEDEYQRLARTFLALSELALFIPIGPVYGRLRHEMTTWLDIQPGFRFLRALDELRSDEWLSDDDDLTSLQNLICERLFWPTPLAFLQLGSQLQPISSVYARHRDACSIRLKHPWAFIRDGANADEFSSFFKDHCPILVYRNGVIPGSESLANGTVQHFMSKFCWRVMFQEGYIWTEDLVPRFATDSGDNRKKDLATTLEALPFLKPDRFMLVKTV
jgi:hypothetical protein